MSEKGWLERALEAVHNPLVEAGATGVKSWESQSILAMLAVTVASASFKGWSALPPEWSKIIKQTQTACFQSNLVHSLATDPMSSNPDWIATWSDLLAHEIAGAIDSDCLEAWRRSFSAASRLLYSPDGFIDEQFQCDCLFVSRPKGAQPVIEVALAALATIATLSAGSLLALQLTRPTDEFLRIRELAREHEWARLLCRRGPRFADRTIWSVKGAWDRSIFENAANEFDIMSDACRRIAEATNCECIEPKAGVAFDDDAMQSIGSDANKWVLKTKSVGLRCQASVIQPAIVETSSSDRLALHLTADHRLSQRCAELIDESTNEDKNNLYEDVLDAVRNAAKAEDEYTEWLKLIVKKSPGQNLQLFVPSVGSNLNELTMFAQNDVWSPSKSTVSEVICPGLFRNEELLARALVLATQG